MDQILTMDTVTTFYSWTYTPSILDSDSIIVDFLYVMSFEQPIVDAYINQQSWWFKRYMHKNTLLPHGKKNSQLHIIRIVKLRMVIRLVRQSGLIIDKHATLIVIDIYQAIQVGYFLIGATKAYFVWWSPGTSFFMAICEGNQTFGLNMITMD
jgi:hypothetical protein